MSTTALKPQTEPQNGHLADPPPRPDPNIEIPPFFWDGTGKEEYHVGAWAYRVGFWPVVIAPKGAILKGHSEPAKGKEPLGKAWGAKRYTTRELGERREWHKDVGPSGNGICLGPDRAPDGGWLIDLEVDGDGGEDSLLTLCGGEAVDTLGWGSTRGEHRLLLADGERLLDLLSRAGAIEGKREKAGVWHLPFLPGLEPRIGGFKADGKTGKQLQSVIPPTLGTDGQPREWNGCWHITSLPEAAYHFLESVADERKTSQSGGNQRWRGPRSPSSPSSPSASANGRANAIAAFAAKALKDECDVVASCLKNRNIQLNTSALKIGTLVGAGALIRSEAEGPLLEAALQSGLGHGESVATIRSGLDAGIAQPRDLSHVGNSHTNGHPRVAIPTPSNNEGIRPVPPGGIVDPEFKNWDWDDAGDDEEAKPRKEPLRIQTITATMGMLKPEWPKRVGEQLFIQTPDYRPVFLNSPPRLFAWIDRLAHVDWTKGANYVTHERFYEHLRMTVAQYDAIETLPHWPPIPGIYYMHEPIPPTNSARLEELLDKFCPETFLDRQLIKALILTLFWGGSPGQRPGFLVTGPDNDQEQGRGIGKSKLCDIISEELGGGYVDVLPTDEMKNVKTRLLSTEDGRKRVVRLDNVKTHRFSWADLEGLMTSSVVSGHSMYHGEGRRPNTLVWLITLNGASLSKDMAQRVIVVKLTRPEFESGWEDDVRAFCRTHRLELLGEIREALETAPGEITPKLRWAAWERDVLTKLRDYRMVEQEIKSRQDAIDDDQGERELIIETFREKLNQRGHNPDTEAILIPAAVAAEWVSEATRERYATNKASAFLKGLSISNLSKSDRGIGRGWVWSGDNADRKSPPRKVGECIPPHGDDGDD
jgi:hypothetical protein